jgi:hypothetical protein
MPEITKDNIGEFIYRFDKGFDSVIKSIKLEFIFEKYGRKYTEPSMDIIIQTQDIESKTGFSEIYLSVEGVVETKIIEGPRSLVALSQGFSVDFFEDKIYLAFNHIVTSESSSYVEGDFYIIGRRCFWSSVPYG